MNRAAFSLFEVLIALAVFAIAVTGLALALEAGIQAALEARGRALARIELESRLAACLVDPPTSGRRVIEARDNRGIRVEETLVPFEARTTNGDIVPSLWKLTIAADFGGPREETADLILYLP